MQANSPEPDFDISSQAENDANHSNPGTPDYQSVDFDQYIDNLEDQMDDYYEDDVLFGERMNYHDYNEQPMDGDYEMVKDFEEDPQIDQFDDPNIPTTSNAHTKPFLCNVCNMRYHSSDDLLQHVEVHMDAERHDPGAELYEDTADYTEEYAYVGTSSVPSSSYSNQYVASQSEEPETSDYCGASYSNQGGDRSEQPLQAQLTDLQDLPGHKSDEASSYDSQEPISQENGVGENQCLWMTDGGVCLESFHKPIDLRDHICEVHIEKYLFCSWKGCERNIRRFMRKGDLLKHLPVHTAKKPHMCLWVTDGEVCLKSFQKPIDLGDHICEVHLQRYQSPICLWRGCDRNRRPLNRKRDVLRHLRVHISGMPYTCEVCKEPFLHDSLLDKHMKTHKEKSFPKESTCLWVTDDQVCMQKCQTTDIIKHIRLLHTGGRKCFECCWQGCEQKEPFKSHREEIFHLREHIGLRSFRCDTCHQEFAHAASFFNHKNKGRCYPVLASPSRDFPASESFTAEESASSDKPAAQPDNPVGFSTIQQIVDLVAHNKDLKKCSFKMKSMNRKGLKEMNYQQLLLPNNRGSVPSKKLPIKARAHYEDPGLKDPMQNMRNVSRSSQEGPIYPERVIDDRMRLKEPPTESAISDSLAPRFQRSIDPLPDGSYEPVQKRRRTDEPDNDEVVDKNDPVREPKQIQCLWNLNGQLCLQTSQTHNDLKDHVRLVHLNRPPHICLWKDCKRELRSYSKRDRLLNHLREHTGSKSLQCRTCRKVFGDPDSLRLHTREIHTKQRTFECTACGEKILGYHAFISHKRAHSGLAIDLKPTRNTCLWTTDGGVCMETFKSHKDLAEHIGKVHTENSKDFKCSWQGCTHDGLLKEANNLTEHIWGHIFERLFKCDGCGKKFYYELHLYRHQRSCLGHLTNQQKESSNAIKYAPAHSELSVRDYLLRYKQVVHGMDPRVPLDAPADYSNPSGQVLEDQEFENTIFIGSDYQPLPLEEQPSYGCSVQGSSGAPVECSSPSEQQDLDAHYEDSGHQEPLLEEQPIQNMDQEYHQNSRTSIPFGQVHDNWSNIPHDNNKIDD